MLPRSQSLSFLQSRIHRSFFFFFLLLLFRINSSFQLSFLPHFFIYCLYLYCYLYVLFPLVLLSFPPLLCSLSSSHLSSLPSDVIFFFSYIFSLSSLSILLSYSQFVTSSLFIFHFSLFLHFISSVCLFFLRLTYFSSLFFLSPSLIASSPFSQSYLF